MKQLSLQTPGVLAHALDQALQHLSLREANVLLQSLGELLPEQPLYPTALAFVSTLEQAVGPHPIFHPRKLLELAAGWEKAVACLEIDGARLWPAPLTGPPLDALTRVFCLRLGMGLERQQPGQVVEGVPVGRYLLLAGALLEAEASLKQTLEASPAFLPARLALAEALWQLQQPEAARQAWLAALLTAPLEVPILSCADNGLQELVALAAALELPGPPGPWLPAMGLLEGVFAWEMVPGPPLWTGSGQPERVPGLPGAVLAFLAVLQGPRREQGASRWQAAEARRQLQRLTPGLHARLEARRKS